MSINLDHIIIIVFLIITLFTGLKASKNIKDIAEYAIANKMFSSEILAITILATYITGGKGIGYTGYVFDDGILPILPTIFCGVIFCFIFIISFILPRIKYFDGCLTAAELMGQIYGIKARFTIGILGSFYNITLVTLQIIWIGNIGELLNIPKLYSIIFGGMFLVIYSAMGGIKSVTITDIIQFIAITVMVPIITYVVLNKIGGIESLIKQTPTQYFNILHYPHLKDYLIYCLWYIFPAFPLSFPFIQRMLIARSNKQLIKSYYISMFFLIIFFALLTLIGLSSIVLKETGVINPQIRGDQIITYLINNYFVSGVKGILAIGLIAAVMSTADSFLNSAGLLLAHDVIKLICDKRDIKVNELKLVRYITFGLGTIAVLWALVNNVLPRIQYVGIVDIAKGINIASEIVALIFTIPLIAGIMGLKGNPSSFFIPTIITAIFFIVTKLFFDNEFLVPITIFINVISFFISNYIINRGFIIVKRDNILRKSTSSHITNYLSNFCTLIKSFKSRIEYYDNSNMFALFIAFNYIRSFALSKKYVNLARKSFS
ncbi:sodium:solute symporter family protein [Candidatus Tisiphia endosymbiont of Parasteatoda lunata]|uniref:sodium:solute symporter family protein n=1 Tax=Candidatus Tisiphia endosymbiont of Parasteatoda lunata TaxID=3066275 RepID=UPI00313F1885